MLIVSTTLSGCVLKYSQHRLEDERFDERLERGWWPPLEIGLVTDDVGVGFGRMSLSFEAAGQELDRDAVPSLIRLERVSLGAYSATARYSPLPAGSLSPYVGGGYGVSRLQGTWRGPNLLETGYDCVGACEGKHTETFYRGYHPHAVAGLELRPGGSGRTSYLLEVRKDFDRGDDTYDLDGGRISLGIRWRS